MKKNMLVIKDNNRILYYQSCKRRADGVVATLVGYSKNGVEYWY